MPGTMGEADLVADLKESLQDSARLFDAAADADFKRLLSVAALAFGRARPRTMVGTFMLVADQGEYDALPEDFHYFKSSLWGISPDPGLKPWDPGFPGRLPDFHDVEVAGVRKISLRPAPTAAQIAVLGSEYRYYYGAVHTISSNAANTTIRAGDRGLLLLRAQAEAMREIGFRNAAKPVQMLDGMTSQPRNGTPGAIFDALMREFERATA